MFRAKPESVEMVTLDYEQAVNFTIQVMDRLGWDGEYMNMTRFAEVYDLFDMNNTKLNGTMIKPFVTFMVYDQQN